MRSMLYGSALLALAGAASSQTVYYVDAATGNDANSGLSYAAAKLTIQAAVNAAKADATPLDTVNVLPGTYAENVYVDFELRLEGRPGATVAAPGGIGFTFDALGVPLTSYTQLKNFVIKDGFQGVAVYGYQEASLRIEHNQILDCVYGIYMDGSGPEEVVHRPLIRYNHITSTGDIPAQLAYGIKLQAFDLASLEAVVHANRISLFEFGIHCSGQSCRPTLRSDFIWRCEWGIKLESQADVRVTNESIAYGAPASAISPVYGIQTDASTNLVLANSIVWIPDTPNYFGDDLDVHGALTIITTFDEDCDPGTLCSNPLLVDAPNGDLRLQRTSPAIGAGDSLYVWPAPTGTDVVDHDIFGGPRITDGLRKGKMWVDCGAHEYNPANLDLVTMGMGSGEPMVDTQLGAQLAFRITGLPGDTGYFWFADKSFETNFMVNPLGNQLVYPVSGVITVPLTLSPSGTSASGTIVIGLPPCCTPSLIEAEQSFQAACIGAASTTITPALGPAYATGNLGNMTRRIEVEINEKP